MYGLIMRQEEMMHFIKGIGRAELYDEIENSTKYPNYLKAVRVTLVFLGFDEKWVDTEFRDALEKFYLNG